ncbi:MAG TPA: YqaE/Pmp3 family membrane protein [Flavisolibacter sp.]|nr:YqaE/Pmp3 family membrane protein [Flavisolibacter sp.]
MKRIITLSLALSILVCSFAAETSLIILPEKSPAPNANQILLPIGKAGEKISLMDMSRIKVKEFESLTGNKMSLANKLGFKLFQKQMRNSINYDGTINTKKFAKAMAKADSPAISKGLYIVLAIFGLAWIGMGVMDNWKGNNWWVNLILTLLFWLPGFIHALIKMKDYYK